MGVIDNLKAKIQNKKNEKVFAKLSGLVYEEDKIETIKREIKDEKGKFQALSYIEDIEAKKDLIKTFSEEGMLYAMDLLEDRDKAEILVELKDKDNIKKALNKIPLDIEQDLRRNGFLLNSVMENMDIFIEYETGKSEAECGKIAGKVLDLQEENEDILYTVKFDILDEKYTTTLDEDLLGIITCYPMEQNRILSLDEKSYKVLVDCINDSKKNNNGEIDTQVVDKLLNGIGSGQFEDLINSIDENKGTNINYTELTKCLTQRQNYFNIKNIEELNNIDNIRIEVCDAIINKDNEVIEKYPNLPHGDLTKFAILEKLYGQDIVNASKIVELYGEDIDNIPVKEDNKDTIQYVKNLKTILNENNKDKLKQFYNVDLDIEKDDVNPVFMENRIKEAYCKEYNQTLLKTENCERLELEDCKDFDIYDAGTDFSMIITSLSPYAGNGVANGDKHNWNEDWNRKKKDSQAFSASYIRNDMLGTAEVPYFCYGFDNVADDSLVLSSPGDMATESGKLTPTPKSNEWTNFCTPDSQINKTPDYRMRYNEMLFKRVQNGERKQPSYIVVFKENGEIANLDMAKKAASDFEPRLPIVVVDKEKCAESEKNKIQNMMEEYEKTGDNELLKSINQKVKNNSFGNQSFNLDATIKEKLEKINIEENKEMSIDLRESAIEASEISTKTDIMKKSVDTIKRTELSKTQPVIENNDKGIDK